MATFPVSIAKYIRSMWMAEMIITYLHIDKQGHLVDWGGYPQHYGLTDLTAGKSAIEQVYFLDGLLNISHTEILEFVGVGGGRCAHVHILPLKNGTWVLMFDATKEHNRQQQMQQQVNELSILTYRQSQLLQDLELARRQLEEEKQELEQASEIKGQFIATLSHELRTPLTSIVGYTKLLNEAEQADACQADYLNNVKSNANHLLSLIDNVLDQAKLDAGQVVLNPNDCDIRQVLADLRTLFFPTAQEKGLLFETNIKETTPALVIIDELAFRQVLINLITNAIKFTEKGFVRLTIGWDSGRLEFSVADSGPGISHEALQDIFTAFHRESTAQNLPGAGLGLAISHHIIDLMNGELTVESIVGEGSVFKGFVQVPIAHTLSIPEKGEEQEIFHTGATILVADDSVDIRNLMEIYLEEGGYIVISANNGAEAVSLAEQFKPDLILMDMQMPVKNGYEAVKQLRSENFKIPIIALSGSSLAQDKNYALEVGCDHYLLKPTPFEDLLKIVGSFIN
ncbi:response regulator [Candidatus Marithioploca araucensis]|uniref:histidine kinase n=1 Tax=Candidatus Marithioploca araucensis TaxID=70273 RepID=A0ABT7VQY4_9GAMM|nr:response regulator [Candidatus Marithioploca araucensis]